MKPVLNKNIPIPLYYQLKQWLTEQIERGELRPGDAIPSERELSEQFEISRMTVRQALLELVNEGKLVREKGKGTFVAEPKINQGLLKLTSFSEDMRSRGMKPGARLIHVNVEDVTPKLEDTLQIKGGSIISITRLRLADDKPMAIETSHLPLSQFPELRQQDLHDQSLYQFLEHYYGITISYASQTIEVGMPSPRERELLQIREGVPVLRTERITYDENRSPIEFVQSSYRGDRYKLYAELVR
ncbi:GntR family transcriptional regulator [Paenactinomyces guangxiensis]|uniref:GntR family transcriptional regulator n=1 Tax=Paenactinomyces guangxiensis TaxID=1490290 RepID=A0A7W1WNN6_9BACL|nr:GntR family transcriptional regulator [Paenactinomyces guangxiensis]MBA4493242.1 GntR family transcriptional regulator [Paenactinomyces guangxiensis]MBH8589908.1 GntR family transcriptional regulator [Paenactinomyces guangxiensis]